VVVSMETAEIIHKLNLRPKRTLRVIAWMNEEMGETGALTYAKDNATEIANHIAAIESDLGAEHPLGFHAKVSEGATKQLSRVFARTFGLRTSYKPLCLPAVVCCNARNMNAAAILGPGNVAKPLASFQRAAHTQWTSLIEQADAIVIFGGDGTIHHHLRTMVE